MSYIQEVCHLFLAKLFFFLQLRCGSIITVSCYKHKYRLCPNTCNESGTDIYFSTPQAFNSIVSTA